MYLTSTQLYFKSSMFFSHVKSLWRPEYGAYMIEGTPGKPYGGLLAHFNIVEANMRYRREEAQQLLGPDEVLMTITNFPRYVKYMKKLLFPFIVFQHDHVEIPGQASKSRDL